MKETISIKDDRVSEDPYQQDIRKFPEDFNLGVNNAEFDSVKARMSIEPGWYKKNVDSPYKDKI